MGLWDGWQAIGVAVVSLMFTLVGLVYAIGFGFNLPKVKAWARNEFYQVIASAIILGGVVILLPSMNAMVNGIVGPCDGGNWWMPGDNHCSQDCDVSENEYMCKPGEGGYNAAFDHSLAFAHAMRNRLMKITAGLSVASLAVGAALSLKFAVAPAGMGMGFAATPGLFPIMDLFSVLGLAVGAGMAMFWAQIYILSFIRLKLITMLPIGIAMRAFPWTRGAGAAMIALVVGLYIVYPMMMVLESQIVYSNLDEIEEPSGNWAEKIIETLNPVDQLGDWVNQIIYIVLIAAVFLPLLNLTMSFAFMKDLARLLGGEIDVSSLAKLL